MPKKSPIRRMAESAGMPKGVSMRRAPVQRARRVVEPDETATQELLLYAENTGELYNQRKSIIANLTKKIDKGTYDSAKAPKIWEYWLEAAAKRYQREFGSGSPIFDAATRRHAAKQMAEQEEAAIKRGEYK
jgi:hypothetical protein